MTSQGQGPGTFLGRLARDQRGNTLAIMAAALIPLAGMVGGGIDLARMYITKTRLQHACDAGALAGRKAMGGGQWSQENGKPNTIARTFFNANYKVGSFGSSALTYNFAESAGKVTGNASATLPMTLTRVIGRTTEDLQVTCEAEMRLPNTDVMFVLDNTGSMASKAKNTDSQTKMEALKSSVKCFYEILARLDTTEVCTGDAPAGGTSSEVQIRFGFVPYDMNVNIGKLLPSSWFADRWTYQSRVVTQVTGVPTAYYDPDAIWGAWANKSMTTNNEADCRSQNNSDNIVQTAAAMGTAKNEGNNGIQNGAGTWQADQKMTDTQRDYQSWKSGTNNCKYRQRTRTYTRTWDFRQAAEGANNGVVFNAWLYKPVEVDLTQMKEGDAWKVDNNGKVNYTVVNSSTFGNQTYAWDGCIEERDTVRQTSYSPRPSAAYDLDIDMAPTSDVATRWRPALKDIIYPRKQTYSNGGINPDTWTLDQVKTFTTYSGEGYSCVVQAQPLRKYDSASDFEDYVDSMKSQGNTYHDIGMLWGAHLLSPTGLWRETNAFTPTGGSIQRHLIFMTDGDACTENYNYQAYGLAWYDRRQTPQADVPTDGCSTGNNIGTLTAQVNARTAAICSAVKNMKDTTLWVIWFGVSQPKIEADMRACASPDRFFAARDAPSLQTTFRQIANQISQLRVTN